MADPTLRIKWRYLTSYDVITNKNCISSCRASSGISNQWKFMLLCLNRTKTRSGGSISPTVGLWVGLYTLGLINLVPSVLSLPPSRKYPGCGWSRVYVYKSNPHREWVFDLIVSKLSMVEKVALPSQTLFWKLSKLFLGASFLSELLRVCRDVDWEALRAKFAYFHYIFK